MKQDLEAHTILLFQSHYINKLLKCFEIDNCNLTKILLLLETNLVPINIKQSKMESVSYLFVMEFFVICIRVKDSGLYLFLFLFYFLFIFLFGLRIGVSELSHITDANITITSYRSYKHIIYRIL